MKVPPSVRWKQLRLQLFPKPTVPEKRIFMALTIQIKMSDDVSILPGFTAPSWNLSSIMSPQCFCLSQHLILCWVKEQAFTNSHIFTPIST